LPSLDRLSREYRDKGLQVLLINMKEAAAYVASFMKEHGYTSKVLLDVDGVVTRKYDVLGIPVSFLIDKEGKVVQQLSGAADWDSRYIRSLVGDLIKE
jgi:peroxiredoxin